MKNLVIVPDGWPVNSVEDMRPGFCVHNDELYLVTKRMHRAYDSKGELADLSNTGPIQPVKVEWQDA